MNYLIIKEDTCPTCQGAFSKITEFQPESRRQETFPTEIYCLFCEEGKVRTEVNLIDVLRDLLGTANTFDRINSY
mgnify:CR=1 FL=1